MKKMFPGYFRPTAEEYAAIWAGALLVLDTNVLLNLYRYSEKTTDEFLSVLEIYAANLWLPYRVAEEFFDGRASVISAQVKKLQELVEKAKSLHADLNPRGQHPLVESQLAANFSELKDQIIGQLESNAERQRSLISKDTVLARIAELFGDEKIGEPYGKDSIEAIIAEGLVRYGEKMPPGYKDGNKNKLSLHAAKSTKQADKGSEGDAHAVSFADQCKPFGDLLIWKQLIQKAKDLERPIVFVTADAKEDWWEIRSNMTVGPRPELIREFQEETGQKIIFYSPEQFLHIAGHASSSEITEEAISEVQIVSQKNADEYFILDEIENSRNNPHLQKFNISRKKALVIQRIRDQMRARLASCESEVFSMQDRIEDLDPSDSDDVEELAFLKERVLNRTAYIKTLKETINSLDSIIFTARFEGISEDDEFSRPV